MLSRLTRMSRSRVNRNARFRRYRPSVESLETRNLLASSSLLAQLLASAGADGGSDSGGTADTSSNTNDTDSAGTPTGSSEAIDITRPIRFDFGTPTSAVAAGFLQVTPSDMLSADRQYGLVSTGSTIRAVNRSGWWADHSRDFVRGDRVTFAVRLHPGATYDVRYAFGDPKSSVSQTVLAEGIGLESVSLRQREYHVETRQVVVSEDGLLELTVVTRSSRPALLNSLIISPVNTPPDNNDPGGTDTGGTDTGGTDTGGTDTGGTDTGGTDTGGTDTGGTDSGGTDTGGTDSGGTDTGSSNPGDTTVGGDGNGSGTDGADTGGSGNPSPFLDASSSVKFDFGTSVSALAAGMIRMTPDDRLADDNLYGLIQTGSPIVGVSRDGWWADHSRDYVAADRFVFAIRLIPGATYSVRYAFGDPLTGRTQSISAEAATLETVKVPRLEYHVATREVVVSDDGLLELSFESRSRRPALLNSLILNLVAMPADGSGSTGGGTDSGSGGNDPDGSGSDGSNDQVTDCHAATPAWLRTFPSSNAPVFNPDQSAIDCSQQFVPGTSWSGLDEQQVFAQRITVASPDQQPAYEYRIGKGSQIYSLRLPDENGQWVDAVATQRPSKAEWVDEVIQTVIVDTETNDRSSESTKNQIHTSGTYENIDGIETFYFPVLDEAWVADDRSFSTISWPQQAHIPSDFKSHFLHMQQIRELGSGVLEVTYVYHNFSLEGEKATFLASPWLPVRHSTFPYQFRSLPDGTLQQDQHSWCVGSSCGPTSVSINQTDGYFVFSSGLNADDPAMAIVFGTDQNVEGQAAETQYRWGTVQTSERDLTATSLQKQVRIEPGEIFYHRFYLVVSTLQDASSLAAQLQSYVDQGFLTPDPSAAADACFAMSAGQLVPTSCSDPSVLVSASSTPRSDWQPLLTIVDNSTGKRSITNDPYLFMRRPYLEEFEVDGILGWVSPETISSLAASQDPAVADLFSLMEP